MTPSDDEEQKPGEGPEAEGFGDDALMEDFEGGGDSERSKNPMVKVGLGVGAVAAVLAGVILFGGEKEKAVTSVMRAGSEVTSTPGGEELPETYRKAVEQTNLEAAEKAVREQGSSLPVPIAPPTGRVTANETMAKDVEDPLARWRRIQEERQKRDEKQRKKQLTKGDPNAEAIDKLSSAMSTQMSSVLEGKKPVEMQGVSVIGEKDFFDDMEKEQEEKQKKLEEKLKKAGVGQGGGGAGGVQVVNILVPAATIEYAQLMIEANSDAPGPVMAQIMSGPLAGSKLLGSFEAQDEYLTLTFEMIVIDGISHPINAIALDPNTTLPGLVTDIDHRYFQRIILPAAASFIEGMSSAIAETGGTTVDTSGAVGTTTTTSSEEPSLEEEFFKGVEEAGKTVSDIINDDAANVEPMIKVAAGTPMGILFLEPVTDESM